jgi:hypothetical protein
MAFPPILPVTMTALGLVSVAFVVADETFRFFYHADGIRATRRHMILEQLSGLAP